MDLISKKDVVIMAYSFDSEDHRLVGSFEYLWAEGTGLAASSTNIKPPTFKAGTIPIFDESAQKWKIIEDHRRETVYSVADQSKVIVEYVGPIKDGFTALEPNTIFETWAGTAWQDQRTDEEKEIERLKQFTSLSRRQFKLLMLENQLLDQVEDAINSIEDEYERAKVKIEYEEATEFHRTSESVLTMCQLLNLKDDDVDDMWLHAMTL